MSGIEFVEMSDLGTTRAPAHLPDGYPSKSSIASRLLALSKEMEDIAIEMQAYAGINPWADKAKEMRGTSGVAREWADTIMLNVADEQGRAS